MKAILERGKYIIIFDEKTGKFWADRYKDKNWRDLTGDGMVLAMLNRIEDLEKICETLQTVREETKAYEKAVNLYERLKNGEE